MPVELRKRKAHQQPSAPAPKRASKPKAAAAKVKKAAVAKKAEPEAAPEVEEPEVEEPKVEEEKVEEEKVEDKAEDKVEEKKEEPVKETKKSGDKIVVGDVINLEGFGGEIVTNDGTSTSLKKLVDESKAGVVLFTYPKASTPGCKSHQHFHPSMLSHLLSLMHLLTRHVPGTNQACLFRDSYEPFTAGGLAIYGLSGDSPKANTTFKDKQKLPYPLLCDVGATLIGAVGLKKTPKGTVRGVFAVDKQGKVLLAEPGSPSGTVDKVKKLVEELGAQ